MVKEAGRSANSPSLNHLGQMLVILELSHIPVKPLPLPKVATLIGVIERCKAEKYTCVYMSQAGAQC